MPDWEQRADDLWAFRDSCTVYAVHGPEGMLLVDAGSGAWLDALRTLPAAPAALLCTHYLRDHSAGAARAARAGIPVHVPEHELVAFADPQQWFDGLQAYLNYENAWEFAAPVEGLEPASVLRDHERRTLVGLDVEVVPLPGATLTQVGFQIRSASGRTRVFCGEAVCGPGALPRVAPLQWSYHGLPGAVHAALSLVELERRAPDELLPSLGEPLTGERVQPGLGRAFSALETTVRSRPSAARALAACRDESLIRVGEKVYASRHAWASSWFVLSDDGDALAIDYGYRSPLGQGAPAPDDGWDEWPYAFRPRPISRRALLHSMEGLACLGVARVDVVLVSHQHDDHVSGINLLRRLQGTECWAAEQFADVLEQPHAHRLPCTLPQPIAVDRRLPFGEPVHWREHAFTLAPVSGHTSFGSLIAFEVDGRRYAHCGDQYVIGPDGERLADVFVYRNGLASDSYLESARWLLEQRPDVVLTGHSGAIETDDAFFARVQEYGERFATLHRELLGREERERPFGIDEMAGGVWPYRAHVPELGAQAQVRVTVRNPLARRAPLVLSVVGGEAVGPRDAIVLDADAGAQVTGTLTLAPTARCRRHPYAIELHADGLPFGQVLEGLITAGHADF